MHKKLKHLKWYSENATNPSEKKKLEELIKQCENEKRLCTIDLNDVTNFWVKFTSSSLADLV